MKATIQGTNKTVTGKTLAAIRRQLNAMLKVEGPRALTATTETGTVVHVELYDGQDHTTTANGRTLK